MLLARLGAISSSILKIITDLFARTTSGSLGTTDTGQTWEATRGTWSANGSQATSADAASTYPIASIPFKTDVTVSASVSEGTGVTFWVTDANNWFASTAYGVQSSYSCNCATCCNTCSHTGGSCGSTTTCNTCSTTAQSCANCGSTTTNNYTITNATSFTCSELGYTQVAGSYCGGVSSPYQCCFTGTTTTCNTCTYSVTDCAICGSTSTPNTCTNSDCTACGSYSCNCSTCYTNNYYLRLLKSVSGTVSQVISDYAVASLPAAVKVVTSGDSITEYAYSDTAMTSALGNTSTTPTSPTKGSGVGIIKAPTSITQGSTVDNFNAS